MVFRLTSILAFMAFIATGIKSQNLEDILSQVNTDSLIATVRQFSGEDSTMIAGEKYLIQERSTVEGRQLARTYLKDRLSGFDLDVREHTYRANGINIYAVQEGNEKADSIYVICAHFDTVTDFGADDNASGVAAALEAARILSSECLDYSVMYAFWDEEERGLIGSRYFAQSLDSLGYKIKAVLNMDMIGYDSDDDGLLEIHSNAFSSSKSVSDALTETVEMFDLKLFPIVIIPGTNRSDHASFWNVGIGGVLVIETLYSGDFNPYYHSSDDRIDKFNIQYFYEMAKLNITALASLAGICETSSDDDYLYGREIEIFPNPVSDFFTILSTDGEMNEVIVTDLFGKEILKMHNKNEIRVDISNQPNGIYLISIATANRFSKSKILKLN